MKESIKKKTTLFGSIATGIASFLGLLLGLSGFMFTLTGICPFCILPFLVGFLALFGLSVGTIYKFNILFILFGIIMLAITIILIINRKKLDCRNGACKVNFKKKK